MQNVVYNSFKNGLMKGLFNFDSDVVKIALVYGYTASQNDTTWNDISSYEISSNGYTSGGQAIAPIIINCNNTTKLNINENIVWDGTTVSTTGAVIYNSSTSDLICYVDFGGIQITDNGSFTLSWSLQDNNIISLA